MANLNDKNVCDNNGSNINEIVNLSSNANDEVNHGTSMISVKSHFMEIGEYSCGSMFGLGEHMDDRAIVANTDVQCLLIPHYWLFEKKQNAGNIWHR